MNNADNLKSLKYSRSLEKEADMDGLAILKKRNIDPDGFVDLLTHMKEAAPPGSLPEFLVSHPDINKRIRYIKEASGQATIREDTALKVIFEKLK